MDYYLIGALLSMIASMLIIRENKDEFLTKYTKKALVIGTLFLTALSWGFFVAVIYKAIKRARAKCR